MNVSEKILFESQWGFIELFCINSRVFTEIETYFFIFSLKHLPTQNFIKHFSFTKLFIYILFSRYFNLKL